MQGAPSTPVSAPPMTPTLQAEDNTLDTNTTPSLLHQIATYAVDFLHPAPIRHEYSLIFARISKYKYAYILILMLLCGIAEYEQPGWFPRPDELSTAVIGFLGAIALIFPTFALLEYIETHTWPWQDEGFVWPWEALLWGSTVYNDETLDQSISAYGDSYGTPASHGLDFDIERRHRHDEQATDAAIEGPSTTPDGSPARQAITIPPTPFLPHGLRPVHLLPPSTHRSGLLGESPMPIKFKHFGKCYHLESDEEEEEEEYM